MNGNTYQSAITYLHEQQRSDGAISGYAAPKKDGFSGGHTQPTIFFSALTLECLRNVPGTQVIREHIAVYLMRHKSQSWTWNYWERTVSKSERQQYPDDLDDTMCALGALTHYNPKLIDGTILAHVANALINTETQPGGPYNTWLINTDHWPAWKNIDLAVNANIAWFLKQQRVRLPALVNYLGSAVSNDALQSAYYPERAMLLYFLARASHSPLQPELAQAIMHEINVSKIANNMLHKALLLSAGCFGSIRMAYLSPLAQKLRDSQNNGHWPAFALYTEPSEDGVDYYAGSACLTTAFVLEALQAYDTYSKTTPLIISSKSAYSRHPSIAKDTRAIPSLIMRRHYRRCLLEIIHKDIGQQISGMASLTALACKQTVSKSVINHLNVASLNGWAAYTIYDDIVDEGSNREQLSVANYASRQMISHFQQALPHNDAFQTYVQAVLLEMDSANMFEATTMRAAVHNNKLYSKRMPNYETAFDSLWQRSYGHSLAASGILCELGYSLSSQEHSELTNFFRHFLIARQLNDDAHDWEADLTHGQLSPVVCLLLQPIVANNSIQLDLSKEIATLRYRFWQKTILEIDQLIQTNITLARNALLQCNALVDPSTFLKWLSSLSSASAFAVTERAQAQNFITTYTTALIE